MGSIRLYEYFAVALKFFFIKSTWVLELMGLIYDVWFCLICGVLLFVPFWILSRIHQRTGIIFLHVINIIIILIYLSLLLVFTERSMPFDHELFTRSHFETLSIIKTFAVSGVAIYFPFIIYIVVYFLLYSFYFFKKTFSFRWIYFLFFLMLGSLIFYKQALPQKTKFKSNTSYYLVCNKWAYFAADIFTYFRNINESGKDSNDQTRIDKEIEYYQSNHPFDFTDKEYPLLHKNHSPDVIGDFFNFGKTPPNIVILVIEGLSRDFSGYPAYPVSFTPFIDSLSFHGLCWNNFLSCAQGTFGVFPAVLGSLPYAKSGFSLQNVLPEHQSLIKILRHNGYYSYFMAGCDLDFDNLSTFLRMQETDFILSSFGSKYKSTKYDPEGWSMGYPDDALFNRSLDILDSIPKSPYINIYLTVTTHAPYVFHQAEQYEKKFRLKMKTLTLPSKTKKALINCNKLMRSVMFVDDCLRSFFNKYKKRKDFSNTIFFITGDHHHGLYPSRNDIDDFHVPLIIYSPMLKAPRKFNSVNTHNNLTPTIIAMLNHQFHFKNIPQEVHWFDDVLDTAVQFRNIHQQPFMLTDREIIHYLYKNYYTTRDGLYRILPGLDDEYCENDSMKNYITRLRENYKFINTYVCTHNKIFPVAAQNNKKLLLDVMDIYDKNINTKFQQSVNIISELKIPKEFNSVEIELSFDIFLKNNNPEQYPRLQLALIDKSNAKIAHLYESDKDITTLTGEAFMHGKWNTISVHDNFKLSDYKKIKDLFFETAFYDGYNSVCVKIKNLKVKIFGIN